MRPSPQIGLSRAAVVKVNCMESHLHHLEGPGAGKVNFGPGDLHRKSRFCAFWWGRSRPRAASKSSSLEARVLVIDYIPDTKKTSVYIGVISRVCGVSVRPVAN